MHLSKLKMKGFKSFAETTEIEFSKGISAIVGPNGSGKSNITDAIRWVLGEQSTKSLRGKKMEDVIFAGTLEKSPLGYAEVVLILDNSDAALRDLPEEVHITRRLFRTGESEYLLNKKSCKLRDIQNIFMDTGLGKNGYSLISQGEIESIISSGPMELRSIVEEAVGIVNYKTRKIEAERKLTRTQDNMDRIYDIINELEKRRGPLKRQAKKAGEYLKIHGELKAIDLVRFVSRMGEITEQITQYGRQLLDTEVQINTINQKLNSHDQQYTKNKNQSALLNQQLEEMKARIQATETFLNQLYGEILVGKEKLKYLETEQERLTSDQENLYSEKQRITIQCDKLKIDLAEISKEVADLEKVVSVLQDQVAQQQQETEKLLTARAEKEAAADALTAEQSRLNADLHSIREKLTAVTTKESLLKTETEQMKKELENEKQHYQNSVTESKLLSDHLTELKALQKTDQAQNEILKNKIIKTEQALNVINNNLAVNQSKSAYLKGLQVNYSDYFPGIQMLMTSKELSEREHRQIIGPVGELLSVPTEYAKAMDVALGAKTQNIVVESVSVADRCIALLKKHRMGRGTFLPLDNLRYGKANPEDLRRLSGIKGYIGVASSLIRYDKKISAAVESLLGKTLIVFDFQSAKKVFFLIKGYTVVTLEGEIFRPGGAIVGGAQKNEKQSPLFKKAEIERLVSDAKIMMDERDDLQSDIRLLKSRLEQSEKTVKDRNDVIVQEERDLWQLKQTGDLVQEQIDHLDQRLNENDKALQRLSIEADGLRMQQNVLIGKLEHFKNLSASEMKFDESTFYEDLTAMNRTLSENQVLLAQKTERVHYLQGQLAAFQTQLADKEKTLGQIFEAISGNQLEKDTLCSELFQKEADQSEAKASIAGLKDKRKALEAELAEMDRIVEKISHEIQVLNHENVTLNDVKNNLERVQDKILSEKEYLEESIYSRYDMNLLMAKDYIETVDLSEIDCSENHQQELRRKIKAMGFVNPEAVEEFAELESRYHFMQSQYEDLTKAKKELEKIINDMMLSMEKQFASGFASLQTIFSRVFTILFEGGTAKLDYTDPDNIMESGIELTAQPPGKNLRHISLLSGGETSMTAIALLFSFLELNPSPFCVIDEIDAALDDSNIIRFTAYMTEMAKHNQFMIITHRKKTLEMCDAIYGVTMAKTGISKLVSVRLSDYVEEKQH